MGALAQLHMVLNHGGGIDDDSATHHGGRVEYRRRTDDCAVARDHPELLQPGTAPKELANDAIPARNLGPAYRAGVKLAYGTDIGQGDHAQEFGLMVAAGVSPALTAR